MKTLDSEKWFYSLNYMLLFIIGLICLFPFLYVLSASISSGEAVITGKVLLFPVDITFEAYEKVLTTKGIWIAYANTIFYTVVGTACSLLFTICGAYPLSKQRLAVRKMFTFFILFTMLFSAGMIPMYLNFRNLGLLDTRFSIIIGFAISTFLVFILKTFFQSIPDELEEAARMDGANDLDILWRMYLPLSKAALATVGLFYAVSRWNGYFWSMVLLRSEEKVPLQVLLQKLIVEMKPSEDMMEGVDISVFSQETIIYSTIVVSIIPIIVVYPYIQKYFAKGAMLGSLKE